MHGIPHACPNCNYAVPLYYSEDEDKNEKLLFHRRPNAESTDKKVSYFSRETEEQVAWWTDPLSLIFHLGVWYATSNTHIKPERKKEGRKEERDVTGVALYKSQRPSFIIGLRLSRDAVLVRSHG